jgi:pyruvate dehydrogenase E1 component alpha subunit
MFQPRDDLRSMNLGELADARFGHEPLAIDGFDADRLRAQLKAMLRIRLVEQHLAAMRRDGHIGGPVHLGVGQEAVAVGVSQWLRRSDRVFGAHRSHSHLLALGSSIHGLFAETLGKDTGLSRGMGGSMHLWDGPNGFYGSVPIVAGTVSLAVGAALAARMQGTDDVGVAYFGDGAVEEGVVHESLNLARVLEAPVLFVVENNLFASHMHISLRQPSNSTARFAAAHDIPAAVVDGNDICAVQRAAEALIGRARAGKGPGFLEAVTFRWYGHVDWREDVDVGVNRSVEDLSNWRARDPVERLAASMRQRGWWSDAMHADAVGSLRSEIDVAWAQAVADPHPPTEALLDRVYAPSPGAARD